jgi:hypothetical protein
MLIIFILATIFFVAFPCVFGLLPNRLKSTYIFMIQELKSLAEQMQLQFAPKKVMTDFELGLMSVLKTEVCVFYFS